MLKPDTLTVFWVIRKITSDRDLTLLLEPKNNMNTLINKKLPNKGGQLIR